MEGSCVNATGTKFFLSLKGWQKLLLCLNIIRRENWPKGKNFLVVQATSVLVKTIIVANHGKLEKPAEGEST